MMEVQLEQVTLSTFSAVFVSGVLTSFTPCVYPLLPIVVGYLGSVTGSRAARFRAAAAYSLGLALVYAALGVLAALTGRMFGDLTQNSWIHVGFGLLLLTLGGSMMDWYEIPIPALKQGKSSGNAFALGLTSGLVASPCTAPVLASLLVYVAGRKAAVTGGALLFTFAIGMNAVLLIVGFSTSALARLPRSGSWMLRVKKLLAILILAAGIYFVYRGGALA